MKYLDVVEHVCGKTWKETEEEEQGGYGVACMIAFLKGVEPNLQNMADHLNVEKYKLKKAFVRLTGNGLFSDKCNAKKDRELLGKGFSDSSLHMSIWTEDDAYRAAWCHIAAIAGGFITRSYR